MEQVELLGHGFVRLDGVLADDLSVVNAARVSFHKRSETEKIFVWDDDHICDPDECGLNRERCDYWHNETKLKDGDAKLISYLMKNRHGTPFEHNMFRWHISCPIFIAREWFRHRIGSFNEMSGRYTKLEPNFYSPEEFRTQKGKPGAYVFEPIEDKQIHYQAQSAMDYAYRTSWKSYEALLSLGVAKEQARAVLPVGIFTQFYWTLNARSLMNFLSLRNHPTALQEIQLYAIILEELFAEQMPVTAAAFIQNDRVAP